jgi:hypothetical protein
MQPKRILSLQRGRHGIELPMHSAIVQIVRLMENG